MLDLEAIGLGKLYTTRIVSVGLVREPSPAWSPRSLRSAADVFADFKVLSNLDREAFVVLHLDGKHRAVGVDVVSVGCLQGTPVHPREVFTAAILSKAAAVMVLHNHPSGDPTPSREDREITGRLKQCGELLGIPLLDHVVIGVEGYYSFSEAGSL